MEEGTVKSNKNIDLKDFKINDSFLGKYQELIRDIVIPYQYDILEDKVEGVEKSHAIENFRIAAGDIKGEFYGMVFQDSDVAKWIEAAAYSLAINPDDKLENTVDEVIDLIERAAGEDGYLNTYFTVKEPEHRWENLHECHELYCAGHMIEAAVAYYEATGKDKLLSVMKKMSDLIYDTFGYGKREGFPGHPEIELALMRLYHLTGDDRYKELTKFFIDERGKEPNFFEAETKKRVWEHFLMNYDDRKYAQNHAPVREQKEAAGHAVRAVYLYTGMADVAGETDDKELLEACDTLFDNIANKQMYITGGIGSTHHGEAFTVDYDLPNDTIYAETCAAIGLMFFADKMLSLNVDSKYSDVLERALYNNVLAGMQLDGKKFFYVNPLEVNPGISGVMGNYKHVLPQRPGWFGCACCPPNVARVLSSIGKYAYNQDGNTVYTHLYISGEAVIKELDNMKIVTDTKYPFEGVVNYKFSNVPDKDITFAVRIPAYTKDKFVIKLNGVVLSKEDMVVEKGYLYIKGIKENDDLILGFDMSAKKVYSNTAVRYNAGCVALTRGPLVYCFEGVDNGSDNVLLQELSIKSDGATSEEKVSDSILGDIVKLKVDGYKKTGSNDLYSFEKPSKEEFKLMAVPYYTWGNRGLNQMRVWMLED